MPTTPNLRSIAAIAATAVLLAFPAAAHATLAFVKNPSKPAVFVAADNGSKQRRVALGSDPHVSPDGQLIAYLTPPKGRLQLPHLYLATASGATPPRWLAVEMSYSNTFAWSPDSTKIAAVRVEEDGTERLTLIDVVAGTQRTVARGYFFGVSFGPESKQIVYAQERAPRFPSHSDLRVAQVAGGKPTMLTHDHRSLNPLWSPAGEIVFVKQLGAKRRKYGPKNELFLMNADGSGVRRLTQTAVDPLLQGLVPTDWSANGKRLLAEFTGQDTSYAVAVNPQTGKQRPLVKPSEQGLVGAAISSDGSRVLGATGGFEPGPDHNVVSVPYGGGKGRALVRNASEPDWSR
jgi:Tol biopolymer transport system component